MTIYVLKQELIDDPVQRIAGTYSSTMSGIEAAIVLLKDSSEYTEYHLIPIEMDKPGEFAHHELIRDPFAVEPDPVLIIEGSYGAPIEPVEDHVYTPMIRELVELVGRHNAIVEACHWVSDLRVARIKFLKQTDD
jgi:hypothetical protein